MFRRKSSSRSSDEHEMEIRRYSNTTPLYGDKGQPPVTSSNDSDVIKQKGISRSDTGYSSACEMDTSYRSCEHDTKVDTYVTACEGTKYLDYHILYTHYD